MTMTSKEFEEYFTNHGGVMLDKGIYIEESFTAIEKLDDKRMRQEITVMTMRCDGKWYIYQMIRNTDNDIAFSDKDTVTRKLYRANDRVSALRAMKDGSRILADLPNTTVRRLIVRGDPKRWRKLASAAGLINTKELHS